MMPNVKEIILLFGTTESRLGYYATMMDCILIARCSSLEISTIDANILSCFNNGSIHDISDIYDKFTEVCMLDTLRPPEYWTYLFHFPLKYEIIN